SAWRLKRSSSTAKRVGISYVAWHLLLHWHTTVLHDEGIPMKAAQDRRGHRCAYNDETLRPPITESGAARGRCGVAAVPRRWYREDLVREWQQIWLQVGRRGYCRSCKSVNSQERRGTQVA